MSLDPELSLVVKRVSMPNQVSFPNEFQPTMKLV